MTLKSDLRQVRWLQTALGWAIQVRTKALCFLTERLGDKSILLYLKDSFYFFAVLAFRLSVLPSLQTAQEILLCNGISLLQNFQLRPLNISVDQLRQFHAELGMVYSWPVCFLAYATKFIMWVLRSTPAPCLTCSKNSSRRYGDPSFQKGWVPYQEGKVKNECSRGAAGLHITVTLF